MALSDQSRTIFTDLAGSRRAQSRRCGELYIFAQALMQVERNLSIYMYGRDYIESIIDNLMDVLDAERPSILVPYRQAAKDVMGNIIVHADWQNWPAGACHGDFLGQRVMRHFSAVDIFVMETERGLSGKRTDVLMNIRYDMLKQKPVGFVKRAHDEAGIIREEFFMRPA